MNNWNVKNSWEGNYLDVCEQALSDENVFNNFKRDPRYLKIVNHMTSKVADEYHTLLRNEYPHLLNLIHKFKENDAVGNPITYNHDGIGEISGALLMYMKVVGDIEKYIGRNITSVVEIGGGFGGQAKMLCDYFSSINKYCLYDISTVMKLQQKYLSLFDVETKSMTFRNKLTEYDLVVANFSWSELSLDLKKKYLDKVISKAKYGHMALNCTDDIGLDLIKPYIKDKELIILNYIPGKLSRPGKIVIWK
jgi:putative sugar O-methyltransferase